MSQTTPSLLSSTCLNTSSSSLGFSKNNASSASNPTISLPNTSNAKENTSNLTSTASTLNSTAISSLHTSALCIGGAPDVPTPTNDSGFSSGSGFSSAIQNLLLGCKSGEEDFGEAFFRTVNSSKYFCADLEEKVVIFSMNEEEGIGDCKVFDALTIRESESGSKTFVVCIGCSNEFEEDDLKDNICSLFDLAENVLECKKILVFIEKYRTNVAELVRAFGYVGFSSAEYLCCEDEDINDDEYCLMEVCL